MRVCRATIFAAAALLALHVAGSAAESPRRIRPDRQPLLVATAAGGGTLSELFATAPAAALGLNQRDYRGGVPGLGIEIESLRSVLDGLEKTGATDLWYCLSPAGSSMTAIAAGTGWRWPPGFTKDAATGWLAGHGIEPGGMGANFAAQPEGGLFFAMSRDGATLQAIENGGKRIHPDDWSGDLQEFLADQANALGLWANPRPLLGAAALASGLDIRRLLALLNMTMPRSASLQLNADKDQIAMRLALDGLLPEAPESRPDAIPGMTLPLPRTAGPFVRLTLAPPPSLSGILGKAAPLYLANIDFSALVPRLASLDVWMDEEGRPRWSLACLMGDKARFFKHFHRLASWADLLADRGGLFTGVSPPPSRSGTGVYAVGLRGFPVTIEVSVVSTGGSEHVFLIAAGRPGDHPATQDIEIGPERNEEPFFSWRIRLDDDTRLAVARSFIDWASERGLPRRKTEALAEALPAEEDGRITVERDSLTAHSPRGMAIWLAPILPDLVRRAGNAWR